MFDKDQFIADCRTALASDRPSRNVREVVARAVADPAAVVAALGEPKAGGIVPVHRSHELTVINVLWPANMVIMPHDHSMWAVIGVYGGREDNIFWRRKSDGSESGATAEIEAAGAMSLAVKDAQAFGPELIHSVVNPIDRVTAAIHVYGGDFFAARRSEWDPESLQEKPYDVDKAMRLFKR
jgi:predicted metal-dependent enzyme (double-stranded beta helix superfamily)